MRWSTIAALAVIWVAAPPDVSALRGVVRGWVIGPGAGIALGYSLGRLVAVGAGYHTLIAR